MSPRIVRRVGGAVLFTLMLLSARLSAGQTVGDRAIVQTAAPIVLLPDANRQPLRVASAGTALEVISREGDWIQVRFQDPQYGPRVGYVESRFVRVSATDLRPMDLSIQPASAQAVTPAAAQTSAPRRLPQTRGGMWFSGGLGYGNLGCADCERSSGLGSDLAFGGTVNPHVLLGGGQTAFYQVIDDALVTVQTTEFRARVYPSTTSGFFMSGGLGLGQASAHVAVTRTLSVKVTDTGWGFMGGIGYDSRVSPRLSVTPVFNWSRTDTNLGVVNYINLGLGITIH